MVRWPSARGPCAAWSSTPCGPDPRPKHHGSRPLGPGTGCSKAGPGPVAQGASGRRSWCLTPAACFLDLGIDPNQDPRSALIGRRRLRVGPWALDLGSWSVAFEARMKLPTIFSALLSNKGRAQGAGGPFRGDGGPPAADAPKTNSPSNPRPRSLRV